MVKALKKGTFVLPNGGKVIKAYGYVYGLVDSFIFTMNKAERMIIYNYAENPLVPLNEMVEIVKKKFGYKKPTLKLSVNFLAIIAFFLQLVSKVTGKKSEIHSVRVKKAGFPTNIDPKYLKDNNFIFKYDFENALVHWRNISPEDF
jgi:nucleoside-diphosphate-sugar epimerase